jgi:hypothetical protein
VSVAVLLDNFVSASSLIEEEENKARLEEKRRRLLVKNPLEPLLKKIAKEFVDDTDLTVKLRHLFKVGGQALPSRRSHGSRRGACQRAPAF